MSDTAPKLTFDVSARRVDAHGSVASCKSATILLDTDLAKAREAASRLGIPRAYGSYEEMLAETSTEWAPWYVIPANSKTHRNLLISTLLLEILEDLKLSYPKPDPALAKLKVE